MATGDWSELAIGCGKVGNFLDSGGFGMPNRDWLWLEWPEMDLGGFFIRIDFP